MMLAFPFALTDKLFRPPAGPRRHFVLTLIPSPISFLRKLALRISPWPFSIIFDFGHSRLARTRFREAGRPSRGQAHSNSSSLLAIDKPSR